MYSLALPGGPACVLGVRTLKQQQFDKVMGRLSYRYEKRKKSLCPREKASPQPFSLNIQCCHCDMPAQRGLGVLAGGHVHQLLRGGGGRLQRHHTAGSDTIFIQIYMDAPPRGVKRTVRAQGSLPWYVIALIFSPN